MKQIRVLVVSDRALVRSRICNLLKRIPELQIVAETGDGWEVLSLIKQHRPDVALIEYAVSRLNAFELTTRLAQECPDVNIIILTTNSNERYLKQVLRSGARGCLAVTASARELELAVKSVAGGESHESSSATKARLDFGRTRAIHETAKPLTPRQRQVLCLIADGYTTKQIALFLNISVKTVETHRMQLANRLDIHSTAELVRYAIRNGLADLEGSQD